MEITFINRTSPSSLVRKRPRIARACEHCRERKVRCDGEMPVCGPCSSRDTTECVYQSRKRRKSSSPKVTNPLSGSDESLDVRPVETDSLSMLAGVSSTFLNDSSWLETTAAVPIPEAAESENFAEIEDNPDAMGAHMSGGAVRPTAFFGSSSTFMFMEQLKDIVGSRTTRTRQSRAPSVSRQANNLHAFTSYDIVLPSRKLADHLLELYLQFTHNLYPFLHRPSFMATYESIWSGETPLESNPYFYASLNIIFAIGGQFSNDIPRLNREETLHVYFDRANKVLNLDSLESTGNLQMIQALLLTCQYLQGTKQANKCWNLVGLTIRIAQSNGLHVDSDSTQCGYIELEMRRRLWWGCVLLDKLLAMTMGRPSMISNNFSVTAPAIIDDEYILDDKMLEQPHDKPSLLAFFVLSVRFFVTLDKIISELYTDSAWSHSVKVTLEGIQHLSAWQEMVPWFLEAFTQRHDLSNLDDRIQRQARIILARYLHGRIILFRVCLLHLLRHQFKQPRSNGSRLEHPTPKTAILTHSTPTQDLTLQELQRQTNIHDFWDNEEHLTACSIFFSKNCVDAALSLAELTYVNEKSNSRGPVWWYDLFYTYTSATVILTARLIPQVWNQFDEHELERVWDLIIGATHILGEKTKSAAKYREFLIKTKAQVNGIARMYIFMCSQLIIVKPDEKEGERKDRQNNEKQEDIEFPLMNDLDLDLSWFNSTSYTGFPFYED